MNDNDVADSIWIDVVIKKIQDGGKYVSHHQQKIFTIDDATRLASAVEQSTTLLDLQMFSLGIGDEQMVILAEAIGKSKSLQSINLSNNDITDDGAMALVDAAEKSRSLYFIGLFLNPITDAGAQRLVEAMNKSRLFLVSARDNVILTKAICGNAGLTIEERHDKHIFMKKSVRVKRKLVAFAGGDSSRTTSPVRKLLRLDGDFAICTRVAQFLL